MLLDGMLMLQQIQEQLAIPIPLMTHSETNQVSQPFRVATVTAVDHSATLGATAIGGVLRRPVRITPGSAPWAPVAATSTGPTPIRSTGFLSVACGIKINLFDYLSIWLFDFSHADLPCELKIPEGGNIANGTWTDRSYSFVDPSYERHETNKPRGNLSK